MGPGWVCLWRQTDTKIRVAVCYSVKNTKLSRLHNNANVITLGSRLTKKILPLNVLIFL